jgi:hypothetical protein
MVQIVIRTEILRGARPRNARTGLTDLTGRANLNGIIATIYDGIAGTAQRAVGYAGADNTGTGPADLTGRANLNGIIATIYDGIAGTAQRAVGYTCR